MKKLTISTSYLMVKRSSMKDNSNRNSSPPMMTKILTLIIIKAFMLMMTPGRNISVLKLELISSHLTSAREFTRLSKKESHLKLSYTVKTCWPMELEVL